LWRIQRKFEQNAHLYENLSKNWVLADPEDSYFTKQVKTVNFQNGSEKVNSKIGFLDGFEKFWVKIVNL
jgi:hypothetical protein